MGEKGVRNCLPECTICHFTMEPRIAANFTMGKTQRGAFRRFYRGRTPLSQNYYGTARLCVGVHFCAFCRRNPLFSLRCTITMTDCAFALRPPLLHVSSTFAPLCVGTHFFRSNPQLLWQSAHLHTKTHVCAPFFY